MSDHIQVPGFDRAVERITRAAGQAAVQFRLFAGRPNFMLSLGGGIGLTILGGPFGTFHDLSLPYRAVYWCLAIGLPTLLLTYLSFLARALDRTGQIPVPLMAALVGLVGAVPSWLLIVALEAALPFANSEPPLTLLPLVVIPVVVVSVLINLLFDATTNRHHRNAAAAAHAQRIAELPVGGGEFLSPDRGPRPDLLAQAGQAAARQRLFARLPPQIGTDLISLQAQGHYLQVTTTQGRALILMRISEAEADLADWPGMRVHRSWWVNMRHARRLSGQAGRHWLHLSDGTTAPVARNLRRVVESELDLHRTGPQHAQA